ncbi:MAG: PHP domain-containing protein [Gammaproteobacteria bacterium]
MRFDLHCHSHFSDGKHAPEYLLDRAVALGLSHLAITDHDYIPAMGIVPNGHEQLTVIPGVEISCEWEGLEIHVLGLFIDYGDGALQDLLRQQQQIRRERVEAMDRLLLDDGINGLSGYMGKLPCISYTRSHVADFLVEHGICKNRDRAFKRYLGRRGRLYVPIEWCSMEQAVSTINSAGGIAIVAHPGRYPLSKSRLQRMLAEFLETGGEAIEASYGNIDPNMKKYLHETAEKFEFYVSAGSDFHDASAHWTDLGKFPALNEAGIKNAIWDHPIWHSGT